FPVLFARHARGYKDTEVTYFLVDGVDDRLTVRTDLVDIFVEVQDPTERLLRWGDVVAFRAENHDGGANVSKVERGSLRTLNPPRRQIVTDEQLVDDELDFLGIQGDMPPPPT